MRGENRKHVLCRIWSRIFDILFDLVFVRSRNDRYTVHQINFVILSYKSYSVALTRAAVLVFIISYFQGDFFTLLVSKYNDMQHSRSCNECKLIFHQWINRLIILTAVEPAVFPTGCVITCNKKWRGKHTHTQKKLWLLVAPQTVRWDEFIHIFINSESFIWVLAAGQRDLVWSIFWWEDQTHP